MATIVFNAVGAALGGPIGGAIGALAGRQADAVLFGPGGRQGPRLKELDVTTSSYGQVLPRHFGRMRVAGSVIWATELAEHAETQGGKGSAAVTTWSYSASFAVAIGSRPIMALGRIWADGQLLRGAAGDLKANGTLRLYTGHGDQPADPLIAAAEGEDRCPAFRDLAYVVFEDLDLSAFHNRIPALTFEVIADDGFGLAQVMGEQVDDADADVALDGISGFSAEGPPAESLQALGAVLALDVDAGGEQLVISPARLQADPIMLGEAAAMVAEDGEAGFGGRTGYARQRAPRQQRPPGALRYFDIDRDYQPGMQHASGQAGPGESGTVELPAAMSAATARALIERAARRVDWSRDRMQWRSAELNPAVAPGATVTMPGIAGRWRVTAREWNDAGVELTLEREAPARADAAPGLASDSGRINPPTDAVAGATALVAFELPLDGTGDSPDRVRSFAAVSSAGSGWSGAALYLDLGESGLMPLGASGRARSVTGTAITALPAASPLLFDRESALEVMLIDPAMQLADADATQIAAGANLALAGGEIIQFMRATAMGGGSWRLEGLLRGRGGTEAAIGSHAAGEPFVLLDARPVPLAAALPGGAGGREIVAIGHGDTGPVAAPVQLEGLTLRPLAPVRPRRVVLADGAWTLSWTRRARGGWQWRNGVDVPLVEESESYVVTLGAIETPVAQWFTAAPELTLAAALVADLAATAPGETLRVRQRGTHALSDPLVLCSLP